MKQEWGLDCRPGPLPIPGKLSIRPPQSKNCSAVPVTVVSSNIIKHHTAAVTKIRISTHRLRVESGVTFFLIKELANEVGN